MPALALLALAAPRPAATASDDFGPIRAESPPYFNADLAISLDADGSTAIGLTVSVPYTEAQWVRLAEGYAASLEFTVVFEGRGKSRLYGGTWERRIAVPTFEATRSPGATIAERRSFQIPPGKYEVRVSVADRQGEIQSTARSQLDLPDYAKVPVGFAELELGIADSAGTFTPSVTRSFGTEVRRMAARAVLFDRRAGSWPRSYPFRYRILDDGGEVLLEGTQTATLARSGEPCLIRPSNSDLFIGSYTLEVGLAEGRSKWKITRTFSVEESGPPRGREFERMLEPLSYIADSREIDVLRALPASEQVKGWEAFWSRRDPTPETSRNEAMIEFLRRVSYAERHFQGFGPGWRSDMGRIYIRYGPPDQVENRPATTQSTQVEIWYYSQPYRRFVFTDREGFGRYVLISPE